MSKRTTLLLGLLAVPLGLHGAPLSFEIGAASWRYSPSGDIEYVENNGNDNEIDVSDSDPGFGLEGTRDAMLWGYLEHPVPLLPNVRLGYTRVDLSGDGELRETTFGTTEYDEPVRSSLELDQVDATLYYKPLRRPLQLDIGVNFKYVDGEASLEGDDAGRERASFSGAIPMLYGRAGFDFPFLDGLSIGAGGSFIGYSGNRLTDFQADIRYRTPIGLGILAGYREQRIKLDDMDDVDLDAKIDGAFIGAFFNF